MRWILTLALAIGLLASGVVDAAPSLHYRIVAEYPHDRQGFTEGLAICNGDLVESTGLYGHSRIVIRSLHTGRLLQHRELAADDFGEGVTCVHNAVLQLTWRKGIAYVYDFALNPLGSFRYSGEGWGLAFDGKRLIESDGSARLRFFRPGDFAALGSIEVTDNGVPVTRLNELEWANGRIYANIWHDNRIAVIDPHSGKVTAWIDCAGLLTRFTHGPGWDKEDVLNGIAYDPDSGHFFVTGKRWPKLFEIAIEPAANRTKDRTP